jgi:hypothetical protein
MILPLSNLPWFTWAVAALLPFATMAYVLKFYRKYLGSITVWGWAACLALVQVTLFLVSFAFIPELAFIANIVALPIGYYVFDTKLKKLEFVSSTGGSTSKGP